MSKQLPQSVSPALLKSLSPREFLLVCATYGLEEVTRRLMAGATDDDDSAAWHLVVQRIKEAEEQRKAKAAA